MKITGMDQLQKQLKKIEKEMKDSVEGEVPFDQLFSDEFMSKNSKFNTITEFFDKSPIEIKSQEDFDNLEKSKLDTYTNENTHYPYWLDFAQAAAKEYAAKKLKSLGFDVN